LSKISERLSCPAPQGSTPAVAIPAWTHDEAHHGFKPGPQQNPPGLGTNEFVEGPLSI